MFMHIATPNPNDHISALSREEHVTIFRLRSQHASHNSHLTVIKCSIKGLSDNHKEIKTKWSYKGSRITSQGDDTCRIETKQII